MRVIDAIRNVVGPEQEPEKYRYSANVEAIASSVGIDNMWDFPEEVVAALREYPILHWLCTDSHVGLDAIWFMGEPAGYALQTSRKGDRNIKWISAEIATRVREFIMSHAERPEFDLLDPEEDIGEDFDVEFVTQALTADGFYEGRPVRALVWYDGLTSRSTPVAYRHPDRPYVEAVPFKDPKSNCVLVQDGDEQRVIPIEAFRLAFTVHPREQWQTQNA